MKKQILETLKLHLQQLQDWDDLEEVWRDIESTKNQIAYLESEIRKEEQSEYEKQLQAFQDHMSNSFDVLMGEGCTNESCDIFYKSNFEISFRGKTVTLYNGADVFQAIEEIIQCELEDETC